MEKIITQLIQAGLSEKEALVYHAALSQGPTTVLKLSRQSNLKRATVYTVIDSLMDEGLMRIDESGIKKVYVAESPEYLQNVMERKLNDFRSVIPDLKSLHERSGKDKIIKTYEGLAPLENISQTLMDQTKRGDYRYFIGGDVGWKDVDSKVQEKYFKWRERISLDVKLLFQDSERAKHHEKMSALLCHEVRVLPKKMKLSSDIIITPRLLVLSKLSSPASAIVIEDSEIIETYRELFLFMWDSIKE